MSWLKVAKEQYDPGKEFFKNHLQKNEGRVTNMYLAEEVTFY